MKYLIIILTTLLIGTRPIDSKKIKKEKREYEIEVHSNGTIIKKLKKTTTYSIDGDAGVSS